MPKEVKQRSGLARGLNAGHKVTPRTPKTKISRTKGHLSKRTAFVREVVKEVSGLAPYERRVIELLRNSKDKRARKLAKKRVRRLPKPAKEPPPTDMYTSERFLPIFPPYKYNKNMVLTCVQQLGTFGRAKRKVDEMTKVIAEARRAGH
ncbi:Ribosomal protein L36e [Macrophomina phaseolina MS6]|uniref:60S ribosomal protein L36 n=1 Tax=Macrophomina phaseolina (strain MS6) TaxID=1126212 RepID=K2QYJ3_MACPH|nr:Ribosomal protein L36e [Macrophomina phaseolina MS6]